MIFDTHTHYDDKQYDQDRAALLSHLKDHNVGIVVNISSTLQSVTDTLHLTQTYDFIYGAVGIHPSETSALNEESFAWLKQQAQQPKIVAIGEIGLDYHYPEPDKNIQKTWFARQLSLARECSLPFILHSREAANDTLDILKSEHAYEQSGVVHCFSYSKEIAKEFLDMNFYLGIGGVITFKNGKKLKDVVAYAPLSSILLETDCPYLAPEPHRGTRNDSTYLSYVVKEIADIKGISPETVIEATEQNAKQFYHLSNL